jgi:hypothetical protein
MFDQPRDSSIGLLDTPPCEEINIGVIDQLVRLDVEILHELVRLANADIRGFIIGQHNLKFKKVPQLFDFVEVNGLVKRNR